MNNYNAQSRLMDYLYDEMDPDERQRFEKTLQDNPDLQQELDEMQATRNLLQEDKDEITPKKLMLIQTDSDKSSGDKQTIRICKNLCPEIVRRRCRSNPGNSCFVFIRESSDYPNRPRNPDFVWRCAPACRGICIHRSIHHRR